jgi:hypothetical protein
MQEHGNPAQYLITTRYIESLRDMTKSNNAKVIFMPVETSTMLSAVGTIKEMFAETGKTGSSPTIRRIRHHRDSCDNRSAGIGAQASCLRFARTCAQYLTTHVSNKFVSVARR